MTQNTLNEKAQKSNFKKYIDALSPRLLISLFSILMTMLLIKFINSQQSIEQLWQQTTLDNIIYILLYFAGLYFSIKGFLKCTQNKDSKFVGLMVKGTSPGKGALFLFIGILCLLVGNTFYI